MTAVHIEHTSLIVDDQDEAIRFFVDALSFDLVEDTPSTTGDGRPKRWVVVRPPRARTGLLLAGADGEDQGRVVGRQFAGRVGLFLRVDDFEAARERMEAAGVDFVSGARDEPYGRVAVFLDVAGNRWDLLGPHPERRRPETIVSARRERADDEAASRAVQASAFDRGGGEPTEAGLLDELRGCDGWIPALSWVAEVDGEIIGHNVCTRGFVDGVPCLGLGPIGVAPPWQGSGVGSQLMWSMIGAADALGEPLIALLGDPAYYARFGFRASTELGIEAPDPAWGAFFQARPLAAWSPSMTGRFRYAAPFAQLD